MLDWSGGWLDAGGSRLEYACWGPKPADEPVIVLLHEGLGCVDLWRGFPDALADTTGCSVIAYSRAGYGRSDPANLPRPLDYMTREAVEVLPDVLDQIGARKIWLFGHSDGATIAAIYAGTVRDDRLSALTLIAPHFFTEDIGLASIAAVRDGFDRSGLESKLAKYHRAPRATFFGWADAWLDPEFRTWDVRDVIPGISVPTLVIQGDADEYGTSAQVTAVKDASAEVSNLILPGIGHAPHLEAQGDVLNYLSKSIIMHKI